MNNSFSIEICYSIKLVLFMLAQRSYLVVFWYHTPAHRSIAHQTPQRCLAELNKANGASKVKHRHHAKSEVSFHRTGPLSATARGQGSKRILGESGRGWLISAHSEAIYWGIPNLGAQRKTINEISGCGV